MRTCKPQATPNGPFFLSQRSERLTGEAIHYWFRMLKVGATGGQWEVIADLTFNDLRYDFASRARAAGWAPEKVASYLGLAARGYPLF